jgi:hypothetical protein
LVVGAAGCEHTKAAAVPCRVRDSLPLCRFVPCSTHRVGSTAIVERSRKVAAAAENEYSSSHSGPYAALGAVAPLPRRTTRRPVPLVAKAGGSSVAVGEGEPVGEGVGLREPVGVSVPLRVTLGVPLCEGVTLGVWLGVRVKLGVVLGVGDPLGVPLGVGELEGEVMVMHWMVT